MGLRVNQKPPSHELHTLRHADETKPLRFARPFRVESGSRIAHGKLDGIRGATELHIEVPYAAMLNGILQSFLRDAEEAE